MKHVLEKSDAVRILTTREIEVLKLMAEGKTNNEIGDSLIISMHTAKAHVCHILHKMGAKDRIQAVVKAMRNDIIE